MTEYKTLVKKIPVSPDKKTKQKDYLKKAQLPSADIDHSGRIVYRRRVTPSGVANSTTSVVPRGTIIVVTRVGLGKVAQLTEDTCFSQDIQALLAKETAPAYSSRFLMYQLMFIMQTVKYNGRGTTISGITKKQLADVSL